MSGAKKVKIISISFVLLLTLLVGFVLFNNITDRSFAPFFVFDGGDFTDSGLSSLSVIPHAPDSPLAPASPDIVESPVIIESPKDEPAPPETEQKQTFQMVKPDIHKGSLILINHEYGYEIPEENDLIDIAEYKTGSYRVSGKALLLSSSVIGPLNDMMDAFYDATGRKNVTVTSAFRDYDRQQEILDELIATVGRNEARTRAARPGHSEHHAGLAVDFSVYSDGSLKTFTGTGDTGWFSVNSHKFGFISRYPEDKTHITKTAYEPWHFRYVGSPHAYFIRQSGLCFEEYIELLMGCTQDKPYRAWFEDEEYGIFFTQDTKISVPADCEADISGNNISGFIVTIKL